MSRRYPEKVPVTFKDVAAYFCEDEWKLLQESQKKFYKKVMKEIHQVLITLGYKIRNPDNLIRVTKREDLHIWEPHEPLRRTNNESPSFCHPTVFPDILLRIKQESGSYCGNWSSDEELEISSSSSKADDGTANRGVLHKRKQEAKLSLDDSVDEGAIKTEDTLAFTDVGKKIKREEKDSFKNSCEKKASRNTEDTIANASILQTIKREEKLSLLDSVDAEEGRSKADLHSADDPFEDSDIPHKRKREERLCLNDSQDTEARGNKDGVGKGSFFNMEKENVEFVKSQRGVDQLLYKGYLHKIERRIGVKTIWKCAQYQIAHCCGRAHTVANKVVKFVGHQHVSDIAAIKAKQVVNSIKEHAVTSELPSSAILAETCTGVSQAVALKMPPLKRLKRTVDAVRRKKK